MSDMGLAIVSLIIRCNGIWQLKNALFLHFHLFCLLWFKGLFTVFFIVSPPVLKISIYATHTARIPAPHTPLYAFTPSRWSQWVWLFWVFSCEAVGFQPMRHKARGPGGYKPLSSLRAKSPRSPDMPLRISPMPSYFTDLECPQILQQLLFP